MTTTEKTPGEDRSDTAAYWPDGTELSDEGHVALQLAREIAAAHDSHWTSHERRPLSFEYRPVAADKRRRIAPRQTRWADTHLDLRTGRAYEGPSEFNLWEMLSEFRLLWHEIPGEEREYLMTDPAFRHDQDDERPTPRRILDPGELAGFGGGLRIAIGLALMFDAGDAAPINGCEWGGRRWRGFSDGVEMLRSVRPGSGWLP